MPVCTLRCSGGTRVHSFDVDSIRLVAHELEKSIELAGECYFVNFVF